MLIAGVMRGAIQQYRNKVAAPADSRLILIKLKDLYFNASLSH